MAKETYTSEKKHSCHSESQHSQSEATSCHSEPKAKNLVSEFNKIAEFVKEKYGANIWFVEIMGKRHSYIAGHKEDSFLPPEVIYINDRYAVVSNEWEKIAEKDEIISTIKMIFSEEAAP